MHKSSSHSQQHSHSNEQSSQHHGQHTHDLEGHYHDEHEYEDNESHEEEMKHYRLIVSTLMNYQRFGDRWVDHMERFYRDSLSESHRKLIPNYPNKMKALRLAVLKNSAFLREIGSDCNNVFHEGEQSLKPIPTVSEGDQQRIEEMDMDYFQMDNLKSTLKQFVREWSKEGKSERDQSFKPIKDQLDQIYSSISYHDRANLRVYCPGSGLGRLPLEIASMGFSCQGIEFSYLMLICSSFMLNKTSKTNEFQIYPYIHQTVNVLRDLDQLRSFTIPDILPGDVLPRENPNHEFSMAAGDFTKNVIPDHWDSICTCFFIDTARNILEYLECIYRMLKKGGYWINMGPLLYHFADKQDSIELSYEQLRYAITAIGFKFLREEIKESEYTSNQASLLKSTYKCQFFTVQKI